MLQKLRDSTNIESYVKRIEKLERESRNLSEKILVFLQEKEKDIIITYHRQGYLPASILYWFTVVMDQESRVIFNEANTISYYTVVYRNPGKLIFFTTNPVSSSTINLLQASQLTGNKILFISPKPSQPHLLDMLSKYEPVYIGINDELEASLLMAMAAYHAASKHYKKRMGRRGERLYEHSQEGFTPIVNELVRIYMEKLENTISSNEVIVTSSKMLEPSATYFVETLRRLSVRSHYEKPEEVIGPCNILLLGTSVEEYFIRELLFKYRMMNIQLNDIIMNTDPLEAQLYIAILAMYLIHSKS